MRLNEFRLLIHHHAVAHVDERGAIWLPSVIGRWVDALAEHFGEIGLLLHQRNSPSLMQDEPLRSVNVKLFSLGAPGKTWDRIPRMRRIRQACASAGTQADGLLIRGITPRQRSVWHFTEVQRKAFLLVGSLKQGGGHLTWSINKGYLAVMARHRLDELRDIAKDATLLVNSPMLVSEIEDLFGREVHFVPTNSLRRSEFAPLQVRALGAVPTLLFCGRVIPEKGIEDLLRAIAIMTRRGRRCHLNAVGPITPQIQTKLKQLALDLGIDAQVNWHGLVPFGARLFELYRDADAFVLPSHSEGFPRVIWEAAANGCPVVTTTAGGIPGLWKHEMHGLLVPPRNVGLLAHAIERLLTDTSLRETLIRQAHSYAKDFTVEACAERLSVVLSQQWGLN